MQEAVVAGFDLGTAPVGQAGLDQQGQPAADGVSEPLYGWFDRVMVWHLGSR